MKQKYAGAPMEELKNKIMKERKFAVLGPFIEEARGIGGEERGLWSDNNDNEPMPNAALTVH
jgi:hypothetical protein